MIARSLPLLTVLGGLLAASAATAFCGFYVAKADADLYNQASQVILARDGDTTVVTMANDYQGDPKEFAMVVPVPTVIQQGDVKVIDKALIAHVDNYSAPRLAEYHDANPCPPEYVEDYDLVTDEVMTRPTSMAGRAMKSKAEEHKVTIEAQYSVEEYDVLVLSAKESGGLITFLEEEGYKLPDGSKPVLQSYIRQDLRFFVAKVNLDKHAKGGFTMLRPLQVRYDSPRFMLPIRLGTVNATGEQDLLVYTITKHGRVETSNYRTVKMPTDIEVPTFVKNEFGDVYRAAFEQVRMREGRDVVVTEYAWPLSIMCDPCSADPLTATQLSQLGADWVGSQPGKQFNAAFLTRLHVRYDARRFPEDLRLHETRDAQSFQGRYVMNHPFQGETSCDAADQYWTNVRKRRDGEVGNLMQLTGWSRSDVLAQMEPLPKAAGVGGGSAWWARPVHGGSWGGSETP